MAHVGGFAHSVGCIQYNMSLQLRLAALAPIPNPKPPGLRHLFCSEIRASATFYYCSSPRMEEL